MRMPAQTVIIDTNVLFAGLRSCTGAAHQILRLVDSGVLTPVISITLLFEYEDVLKRKQKDLALSDGQIDVVLDNICSLSRWQKVYFLWRPYLNDPKDDHVLEVAVASETKVIITHNVKDFTGVERFGIVAVRPGELLEAMR